MKKLLLTLMLCCGVAVVAVADEISQLKKAITSQLLSDDESTALVANLAQKYFPDGVETDQCLMEVVAYPLPSDELIGGLLSSMSNNESWGDIDYLSPSRSAWVGRKHVKRILDIARGYKSPQSKFYNDPKVLETLKRAIEYWCDGEFICTNWWYNEIGVPKEFAPVLLLLEGDISPELMTRAIKILDPAEIRELTGQNKVWVSGVTFIKGLLLRSEELLERTSSAIRLELRMSEQEGIQYDYSFHQHGAMQQFGNYGLAFASSQSYWMRVFSGTSYDFTPDQKEIMRGYMTRGINLTIWRGLMDVSSCGRQVFYNSQAGKGASLLLSNLNMIDVDNSSAGEYQDYIDRNFITPDNNNLKGNFSFPISKYTIHRTDDFMFSVKMCSKRIIGGETTNNENMKGYHLADGATMIYRTGGEYDNIFAVWDGKYMPGTTVEYNDKPLKVVKGAGYVNGSDFVGCMSRGDYGVTAMEYRRDGVSANKSWFFMGDVVLCLGSGISSQSGDPLVTTLNQCWYGGDCYSTPSKRVEKGQTQSSKRVVNGAIGYESLDGSKIESTVREQLGDWYDVAYFYPKNEERGDVFTAQIHHAASKEGSYSYVVRPSVDVEKFLAGKCRNNFKIIQNDTDATVVESDGRVMVVFWRAGAVKSKLVGKITASAAVMAILSRAESGEVECQTYDPLDAGAEIIIN